MLLLLLAAHLTEMFAKREAPAGKVGAEEFVQVRNFVVFLSVEWLKCEETKLNIWGGLYLAILNWSIRYSWLT